MAFHVLSSKELRRLFTQAVLREYSHPCISPLFADYEYDSGKSAAFLIRDSFAGNYEVTIKRVS